MNHTIYTVVLYVGAADSPYPVYRGTWSLYAHALFRILATVFNHGGAAALARKYHLPHPVSGVDMFSETPHA